MLQRNLDINTKNEANFSLCECMAQSEVTWLLGASGSHAGVCTDVYVFTLEQATRLKHPARVPQTQRGIILLKPNS